MHGMTTPTPVSTYYSFLDGEIGADRLPLADDVTFRSPGTTIDGAEPLGEALSMLGDMTPAGSLEIRHQATVGDTTMTFYDFELMGRRPMAERVRVDGDRIVEIELIFDAPTPPTEA